MDINDKNTASEKEESRFTVTICYIHFFNTVRDDASFRSTERPFQVLAPLKEIKFWPVFELFLGSLKSVSVFLKHPDVSWDALVNRLHIY